MQAQPVKLNAWIQAGFNLYKENFATLLLVTLIAMLLTMATCGILGGPLAIGVALVVLRLIDRKDPKPEVGDVFKGFDLFLPSFLLMLGVGVISWVGFTVLNLVLPIIGFVLGMFFVYALGTSVMFSIFLIAERRMDALTAVKTSFEVVKLNFWPFLGLYVVASLLAGMGSILCGIGIVITMPIMACIIGVAYRDVFSTGETTPPAEVTATEPPPPAPPVAEQAPPAESTETGSPSAPVS